MVGNLGNHTAKQMRILIRTSTDSGVSLLDSLILSLKNHTLQADHRLSHLIWVLEKPQTMRDVHLLPEIANLHCNKKMTGENCVN